MYIYLIRRTLWAIALFLAITVVTYIIFFIVPVNPARLAVSRSATQEDIERAEKFLGLDKPVYVQYYRFLKRLVWEQSLGQSFATRRDVNQVVGAAAPVTASLVFGAVFFWMLIALPIGILSALRPRSLLDRAGMVYVLIGISLPSFWFGLVLAFVFGFKLGWAPISGYCDFINPDTECGGPVQWAYHMLLPWATLSIIVAGYYVRFIRASVMETMNEDYVRTSRAKGAPEWIVIRSHVLRNAMLPVVTMLGMDIGLALGGAIFIENVFGLPGLGQVAIESIFAFDLPIIQGVTVFGAIAIIVFNFFVDILYAWVDPRIRIA